MQTKETLMSGTISKNGAFSASMMSVPNISDIKSTYEKTLNSELELKSYCLNENSIQGILSEQHPIINTWLLLSSISIFFLSAILFII